MRKTQRLRGGGHGDAGDDISRLLDGRAAVAAEVGKSREGRGRSKPRPAACARKASPPTPPVRSPSADSEADVLPTLRRSTIARASAIQRHWSAALPGSTPKSSSVALGPADYAALAVRHDGTRRGASFSFLARGALQGSSASEGSDCDSDWPARGQCHALVDSLLHCEHGTDAADGICDVASAPQLNSAQAGDAASRVGSGIANVAPPDVAASCEDASASGAGRARAEDSGSDGPIVVRRRPLKKCRSAR